MIGSPFAFGRENGIQLRDGGRILCHKVRPRDVERIRLVHVLVEGDHTHLVLDLRQGEVRIPDRPRVDDAPGEGDGSVRRRQWCRRDVAPGKAGLVERRNEQVVRTRALAERDALALEVGERFDRGVRRHDDRLGVAVRRHRRHVRDLGRAGLCEDRRRVADETEIDAADIDRLEQRRPELKVDPLHLDAERLERVLDGVTLADGRKQAALLRADANLGRLVFGVGRRDRKCGQCQRGCKDGA
ncbi:hypothetical protein chiPu_0030387, partial [Chiloscyllium punctatum]|nr:hypothetical protein [Chiloscyllium punctatum]